MNLVKKPAVYGAIASALGGQVSTTTAVVSASQTTAAASGGGTAQHWGQCGGELGGAHGVC